MDLIPTTICIIVFAFATLSGSAFVRYMVAG